jgi:hypothetical protein
MVNISCRLPTPFFVLFNIHDISVGKSDLFALLCTAAMHLPQQRFIDT